MTRKCIVDLETSGLDIKECRLWCICCKDLSNDEVRIFQYHENNSTEEFENYIRQFNVLIMHNGINFDMQVIRAKFPRLADYKPKIIDTLILSRLLNFYRPGGHSLAAWANTLKGTAKVENDVWTEWSDVILERCRTDIEITHEVYLEILKEHAEAKSEKYNYTIASQIEHKFAEYMTEQEEYGVLFDIEAAIKIKDHLTEELIKTDQSLIGHLPPTIVRGKENRKIFLLNGNYAKDIEKYFGADTPNVWGPFTKISYTTINLNSEKQVKKFLFDLGWKPDTWNYQKDKVTGKPIQIDGKFIPTSPKITIESLESLRGVSGEALKMRFKQKHRLGQIESLIENLRPDGRLSAKLNTLSASTSRTTHRVVANIPKASPDVYLGKEFRQLFTSPEGYVLVGCDAAALEARIFAHYLADYLFIDELLNGDVHTINQELWGLETRNTAKGVLYAMTYGAGAQKLEQISGIPGNRILDAFKQKWPNFQELKQKLDIAGRRGYIRAIDGRKIQVKFAYKALNYLIQSADSIIMKTALCFLMKNVKAEGLDAHPVINYHDEFVFEVVEQDAKRTAELMEKAISDAGKYFKLRCPLEGTAHIGKTWAEIH